MKRVLYHNISSYIKEWLIVLEGNEAFPPDKCRLKMTDEYIASKITVWDTVNKRYKITKNRMGPQTEWVTDEHMITEFLTILMS